MKIQLDAEPVFLPIIGKIVVKIGATSFGLEGIRWHISIGWEDLEVNYVVYDALNKYIIDLLLDGSVEHWRKYVSDEWVYPRTTYRNTYMTLRERLLNA